MSNYLLYGVGIGTISTFLYAILNNNTTHPRDNTMEHGKIFCIIVFVSILILYITGGSTQSITKKGITSSTFNSTPPF